MGNTCVSVDHIKSYKNKKKAFGMKGLNLAVTAGRNTATMQNKVEGENLPIDDMPVQNKENEPGQIYESNSKAKPKFEAKEKKAKDSHEEDEFKEEPKKRSLEESKTQNQKAVTQDKPKLEMKTRTESNVMEKKPVEEELAEALRSNREGNTERENSEKQIEEVQVDS